MKSLMDPPTGQLMPWNGTCVDKAEDDHHFVDLEAVAAAEVVLLNIVAA